MSQYDWANTDPAATSGTELATKLDQYMPANETNHAGATRPAYIKPGMLWLKDDVATNWRLYLYDGAQDVLLFDIDSTTGAVNQSLIASAVGFTPVGGVSAINVQDAIAELDSEKFPKTGGVITGNIIRLEDDNGYIVIRCTDNDGTQGFGIQNAAGHLRAMFAGHIDVDNDTLQCRVYDNTGVFKTAPFVGSINNGAELRDKDNVRRLRTSIVGIDVTGTLTCDDFVITAPVSVDKQMYFPEGTLLDNPTIAWNLDDNPNASITLITDGRIIGNPTGMVAGGVYVLRLVQDGTGNKTVNWSSAYKWGDAGEPTLSTGANQVDIMTFYSDGTNMYGTAATGF
jgi:hypothetical protein